MMLTCLLAVTSESLNSLHVGDEQVTMRLMLFSHACSLVCSAMLSSDRFLPLGRLSVVPTIKVSWWVWARKTPTWGMYLSSQSSLTCPCPPVHQAVRPSMHSPNKPNAEHTDRAHPPTVMRPSRSVVSSPSSSQSTTVLSQTGMTRRKSGTIPSTTNTVSRQRSAPCCSPKPLLTPRWTTRFPLECICILTPHLHRPTKRR